MNKIILGLVIGMLIMSCSKKSDKENEKLKKQILLACEDAATQPGMSSKKKDLVKEYCSCSLNKMEKEFSYDEMLKMNNPSPGLKTRLINLTESCLEDLKIKLEEK